MLKKTRVLFMLLLMFPLVIKAQEIPHNWLLSHKIKKMHTWIIDSLEQQRLLRVTTVDAATGTVVEKEPRDGFSKKDTLVHTTRYNQWLRPVSISYTSPELHTSSTYTYPKNDSTEMVVTHVTEIHRGDSLVYSNEWTTRYKTLYKKNRQVRYVYEDEKLRSKAIYRTKGHTRTVKHKYYQDEPGLRPLKEIQVTNGSGVFSTVTYRSDNPQACTKMTVHRQKLYDKTDKVMELTVTTDYCGKKTYRYRFGYFY